MTHGQHYLIEAMVAQLTVKAVQEYKSHPWNTMEMVYGSDYYKKLSDVDTGLYTQSVDYNYELLRHEIERGGKLQGGNFSSQSSKGE